MLHLISILQMVMEYCIGSASNLLEGWFVFVIPLAEGLIYISHAKMCRLL